MENIFAEMGTEIGGHYTEKENFDKNKRSAFVFITTESEANYLAIDDLKKIEAVKEVYLAHGAYDIVAKVSGESFDHVREIVQSRIRNLNNIKSTLTLTII